MAKIKINLKKTVNNTPVELPKQRIVSKTPLVGGQKYLPSSGISPSGLIKR